jgi:hypothetical protein
MQYYKGQWTFHPGLRPDIQSLLGTRDLLERSVRAQLLRLKPNVQIRGASIADELLWSNDNRSVEGLSVLAQCLMHGPLPGICFRSDFRLKLNMRIRGTSIAVELLSDDGNCSVEGLLVQCLMHASVTHCIGFILGQKPTNVCIIGATI